MNINEALEEYLVALDKEKEYIKRHGFKQYRVENGKYVDTIDWDGKEEHVYNFEMDTELFVPEDAMVKLIIDDAEFPGRVLVCENFQITIALRLRLWDTISKAFIVMDSWRLLEALQNKLSDGLVDNPKLAQELVDGKEMSTSEDISKIKFGQKQAKETVYDSDITMIWGPPGTGKTYTMAEMAIDMMDQGKEILIVSHSNVSVDGIALKIGEILRERNREEVLEDGDVIRYGYIRDEKLSKDEDINVYLRYINDYPELKEELNQLQMKYDQLSKEVSSEDKELIKLRVEISKRRTEVLKIVEKYVYSAKIVATTMSKAVVDKIFEDKYYDAVFFDEVSMAYVPQIFCASTMAREKFVCVGDFMQLAPIAKCDERMNSQSKVQAKDVLSKDIFEFMGISKNGKAFYHPWLVMLDEQRRMHPKISEFPRKNVYKNLLKDHESVVEGRNEIASKKPFKNEAITFIDLTGTYNATAKNKDNSRYNLLSAVLSFSNALVAEKNGNSVSIITPYVAQTKIIKSLIDDYRKQGNKTDIRCATVHQFQGSESDVVLFDAVESFPYKKPGWLMGKNLKAILRLVNVAVTRARGKLIVLANKKFWSINYSDAQQSHLFYRLINYLSEEGNNISHANDSLLEQKIEELNNNGWIDFYTYNKYLSSFYEDLKNAKQTVTLMLPSTDINEKILDDLYTILGDLVANHIAVKVYVSDKEGLPDNWKKSVEETEGIVFPIAIIDEEIIWYGAPFAEWKFQIKNSGYLTICPIAFRVEGDKFIKMIDTMSKTRRNIDNNILSSDSSSKNRYREVKNSGLIQYASTLRKCPICKKYMSFTRGRRGKFILWCNDCKKVELMKPEELQFYLQQNNVKCPIHNCEVKGGLGKKGLYIRCATGHFLEMDEV
ncbi:MAG: PhoH family protein [Eubacterium sp.]|nr:PhoH family protein [Eubacterium sp.]